MESGVGGENYVYLGETPPKLLRRSQPEGVITKQLITQAEDTKRERHTTHSKVSGIRCQVSEAQQHNSLQPSNQGTEKAISQPVPERG
jgi:hypothetical protein